MMKLLVDTALTSLKTIPDGEMDAAVTAINNKDKSNAIVNKLIDLFAERYDCIKWMDDPDLVKNLGSAPIQKQISRLANDSRFKKLNQVIVNQFTELKLAEDLDKTKNPETKKLLESMLRKFKLLPQVTLKEKLAKVWEAIKNFFKKVFCCCKKKEKEGVEVVVNQEPVNTTQLQESRSPRYVQGEELEDDDDLDILPDLI
jgi:hypothetical protein